MIPTTPTTHDLAAVTNVADADVTLPLAAGVLLVLLAFRRDLALAWLRDIGGALVIILALKIAFGVMLGVGTAFGIRSPSGHTETASSVYGGLLSLLTGRPWFGTLLAVVIAIFIGVTRLGLGVHSLSDVLVGGLVGIGAVVLLGRSLARRPPSLPGASRLLLLLLTLAVVAGLYGHRSTIEGWLERVEYHLAVALGVPTWKGEALYVRSHGGE